MERTLKGKVAIVTGASSGIGEATVLELASRGASVVAAAPHAEVDERVIGGGAPPRGCEGGRIINVSSVVGKRAIPKVGGYCSTKFALNALSDSLRVEVADRGVSVTSVYPGTTRTSFRDNSRRTKDEKRGWRPRGVTPEKVAKRIAVAAERGPRDVYVTPSDRLFVAGVTLFPGLTDRVLRAWAKG